MRHFFLTLLLIIFTTICYAKADITAYHLTTDNGLPDNNVRCLKFDSKGFLWFATQYSLYRYDGYSYRQYQRSTKGDMSLMPSNRIVSINNWTDNQLLFRFNTNQLLLYNLESDKLVAFCDSVTFYKSMYSHNSMHLYDNLGRLFVYDNKNGTLRYTDSNVGKSFTLHIIDDELRQLAVDLKIYIVTDKEGRVWVSTNGNGLFIYYPTTGELQHLTTQDYPDLLPSNHIVAITLDMAGDIVISNTRYGLTRLHVGNKKEAETIKFGKSRLNDDNEVKVLTRLQSGEIVAATAAGQVYSVDEIGEFKSFAQLPSNVQYNNIGNMPDGSLWATTRSRGVFLKDRFYMDGQRTDHVVVDNKRRVWVASVEGLIAVAEPKKDGSYGEFQRLFTNEKLLETRQFLYDKHNRIWIGSNGGVVSFCPDELLTNPKSYQLYKLKNSSGSIASTNCLHLDHLGYLWVGTTHNGLYRSNIPLSKIVNHVDIQFEDLSNEIITNLSIQSIISDRQGNMWIGTENGCTCYNPKNHKASQFLSDDNRLLNYCNPNCTVALSNGNVWFGTLDGIVVHNLKQGLHDKRQRNLEFTELIINGQPTYRMTSSPLGEVNINGVQKVTLAHNQNSLTINVSDMNIFSGNITTYRYFMEGIDEWSETTTSNSVNYQNLLPGRYIFHVEAICGGSKTEERMLEIVISEPWWNTWWAYIIYIVIAAVVVIVIYNENRKKRILRQRMRDEHLLTEYRLKFFTNISHEFRTPLTLILSSIDKLEQLSATSSTIKGSIQMMRQNSQRLKRLIDQLMEFRKIETGNLQLRVQETDVSTFIYNIYQSFHEESERRRINYQFSRTATHVKAWVDRGYIDKIIFNLLSNAFKYTPVGGEITVYLAVNENKVLSVKVTDNGIGVPADKRDTIFDRYSRFTSSLDSMGIGLNLSYELAVNHHGCLTYNNRMDVCGSVFTLSIPIGRDEYAENEVMSEQQLSLTSDGPNGYQQREQLFISNPLNDRCVLIVEDDIDIQDILHQELSQYFHVMVATDGAKAVEMLEQKLPDLVITDYMMPNKNGMELLQHIRKSSYRYLPVIMLTAIDSENTELKSMIMGADAYVTKPFSMQLLIAQTVNLIKQRSYLKLDYANTVSDDDVKPTGAKVILPELITEERDLKLIARFDRYIDLHMSDANMNIDNIAEALDYKRTNFYKKITSLVGCSPKEYVRKRRMQHAAEMLKDEKLTIAEVAYQLGFSTPQYFSTCFKAYFGIKPSEYQKR